MPILIHGDAAFAGQGVIMETFNLMNLAGYKTGGTIHIVVNNQIGFTTNPRDSRSTQYCTDIAKFVQVPIFHVNAEDPEACVAIAQLALEFRQQLQARRGHRHGLLPQVGPQRRRQPAYTQPLQSKVIEKKKPLSQVYAAQLAQATGRDGVAAHVSEAIGQEFEEKLAEALGVADNAADDYRKRLEQAHADVKAMVKKGEARKRGMEGFAGRWKGFSNLYSHDPVQTGVPEATLDRIADAIGTFPDGFTVHPNLIKTLQTRRDNIKSRKSVDWGTAEALAFGSLVLEGTAVRLSGQDSRRGTFTQRHAVVVDFNTGAEHYPLSNLDPKQASFDVYDSSLSEAAVLGFEYGYSLDDPGSLVMWEAQFGDFANGAQVIIDQFLASGESKWNALQRPGAAPAARLRGAGAGALLRAARTLPADVRRGQHAGRVPDHAGAVLPPAAPAGEAELPQAARRDDAEEPAPAPGRDVAGRGVHVGSASARCSTTRPRTPSSSRACCSARARSTTTSRRSATNSRRTRSRSCGSNSSIRGREAQLAAVLGRYRRCREWVWVQEESQNMGGWSFVEPRLRAMNFPFDYVGRDASASPATGSHHVHEREQELIVAGAFAVTPPGAIGPGYVGWVEANGANGDSKPATSKVKPGEGAG